MQSSLLVAVGLGLLSVAWCHFLRTPGENAAVIPHSHPPGSQMARSGREWRKRFRGRNLDEMTIEQFASWANSQVQTHQACGLSFARQRGIIINSFPNTVCECLASSSSCDGGTEDRSRSARRQCRIGEDGGRCCCMSVHNANAAWPTGTSGSLGHPLLLPRLNTLAAANQLCGESMTRRRFSFNLRSSRICECTNSGTCGIGRRDRSSTARRQCRALGDSAQCCCRSTPPNFQNRNVQWPGSFVGFPASSPQLAPQFTNARSCGLVHLPNTVCQCRATASCFGQTEDVSVTSRQQCQHGRLGRCCCSSALNRNVWPGTLGLPPTQQLMPRINSFGASNQATCGFNFLPSTVCQCRSISSCVGGTEDTSQVSTQQCRRTVGFLARCCCTGAQNLNRFPGTVLGTQGVAGVLPGGVPGMVQVAPGAQAGIHPGASGHTHPGVAGVFPGTVHNVAPAGVQTGFPVGVQPGIQTVNVPIAAPLQAGFQTGNIPPGGQRVGAGHTFSGGK